MICEVCNSDSAQQRRAMTAYAAPKLNSWGYLQLDGEGLASPPDPNPDPILCDACWDDYYTYWQEQWDDYHANCI